MCLINISISHRNKLKKKYSEAKYCSVFHWKLSYDNNKVCTNSFTKKSEDQRGSWVAQRVYKSGRSSHVKSVAILFKLNLKTEISQTGRNITEALQQSSI